MAVGIAIAVSAWPSAADAQASRSPYGRLDPVTVLGSGAVLVTGWAKDPDTTRPIAVIVSVAGTLRGGKAGLARRDIGRRDRNHGYSFTVTGIRPGPTQICAGAFNVGPGDAGRLVGCQTVNTGDPAPIGNLDAVTPTDLDAVRVSGWALDPDTPFPTPFEVLVNGTAAARGVAADRRDDIGAYFPGMGPLHGFTVDLRVPEGTSEICIRPQNLGPGTSVVASCRSHTTPDVIPQGSFDAVSIVGAQIVATGWAFEREHGAPPTVVVTDDGPGPGDPTVTTVQPTGVRPDAAALLRTDQAVGFTSSVRPVEPGLHRICLVARNRGWGRDSSLGCRDVTVADRRPIGALEAVVVGATSVTVTGWAADPDDAASVQVRVTTDRSATSVTAAASINRPDGRRGYQITLPGLIGGSHRICVEATDRPSVIAGLDGPRTWCGGALLGSIRVGTSGVVANETPVGPPVTSGVAVIDRDGGVSAKLRDGSQIWLFGDSTAIDGGGALRYFVSGTAAWSSAAQPDLTRDAAVAGRPVLAATPTSAFPSCPAASPSPAMWPMSAVVVPDGPRDKVIAWFADVCLGSQPSFVGRGTAVAEWTYDPADPPIEREIRFTVTNQLLWTTTAYGSASLLADDGNVITYHCNGPDQGGWYTLYGPCTAARVAPTSVADPSAYRYWNGSTWVANATSAIPLVMPASQLDGVGTHPPAAFTVTRDVALGLYVMAYTSWPGFTGTGWLRFATTPVGPWTEPLRIDLGSCDITIGGRARSCYAITAQPWKSSSTALGLGFYRSWIATDPRRGGYRSGALNVSVTIVP